jgi:hypothetical protein
MHDYYSTSTYAPFPKMRKMRIGILHVLFAFPHAFAFDAFRMSIPNSLLVRTCVEREDHDFIPTVQHETTTKTTTTNSCIKPFALGHHVNSGGGPLNSFGRAFYDAGKKWSVDLCLADSDGDGWTNGQEVS